MDGRRIIVIGASAGGLDALQTLVAGFPAQLNAAIFVVLHIGASTSRLPMLLARRSQLPVCHATDGQEIMPGRIYVAPPDRHLVLEPGRMRLIWGPRENFTRPAIDPLLRSAAAAYGDQVIGVVLTGHLDDGTAGLLAIGDHAGITIVQDPDEAFAPSMPCSAAAAMRVHHACGIASMAQILIGYDPPGPAPAVIAPRNGNESGMADQPPGDGACLADIATPSPIACPECGAVLFQRNDRRILRFRCPSGHAITAGSLRGSVSGLRPSTAPRPRRPGFAVASPDRSLPAIPPPLRPTHA